MPNPTSPDPSDPNIAAMMAAIAGSTLSTTSTVKVKRSVGVSPASASTTPAASSTSGATSAAPPAAPLPAASTASPLATPTVAPFPAAPVPPPAPAPAPAAGGSSPVGGGAAPAAAAASAPAVAAAATPSTPATPATPAAKKAAKKAAVASPASVAAPAITTTKYVNDNSESFIRGLNFAGAKDFAALQSRVASVALEISKIDVELGRVFKALGVTKRILVTAVPNDANHIPVLLGDIRGDCYKFFSDIPNSIDDKLRDAITETIFHILSLVQRTEIAYHDVLAHINPAPTPPASAPPITPPAAPAAPTDLERRMNEAWERLEDDLKSPNYSYAEKIAALRSYAHDLENDSFGDKTKDQVKSKLASVNNTIASCEKINNELRQITQLSTTDTVRKAVERLKDRAVAAKKKDELAEVVAEIVRLKSDFIKNIISSRRLKTPYEDTDRKGKTVTKYRDVDLGDNPITFDILFADIQKIIYDTLNDDFIDAQQKRTKGLEDGDKKLDEAKKEIDLLVKAIVDVIKLADGPSGTIIASARGRTSKELWKAYTGIKPHNGIYGQKVGVLQTAINNSIVKIKLAISNADSSEISKAYARKELEKITGQAITFNTNFNTTKLSGTEEPAGDSASTLWRDVYMHVEGVMKDGRLAAWRPDFINQVRITVPTLEMTQGQASPTSPTSLGSWSPFETTGAVNARINGIPTKFGSMSPMKRRLIVGGSVALGVAAAALISFVLNNKKEGAGKDPDAKPKTAVTASANMADTQEAIAQRVEQAATRIERVAKGVVSDRSAAVARMSSAQVLESIQLKTGESVTFTGEDMLNSGNYNSIKLAGSGPNANAEGVLKYNILAQLVSDMSSAPADNDYSVSRIRLLRFVLSEDTNFKPKNITAASSTAALAYWALDTSREAEKFVIYFYKNKNKKTETAIYLRGDAGWRKAIEDTVRGHMVSGSSYDNPGILTDDDMDKLFNNTTTQKRWDVLEQAQSNGTLADIMKNKKEYFVKNK